MDLFFSSSTYIVFITRLIYVTNCCYAHTNLPCSHVSPLLLLGLLLLMAFLSLHNHSLELLSVLYGVVKGWVAGSNI